MKHRLARHRRPYRRRVLPRHHPVNGRRKILPRKQFNDFGDHRTCVDAAGHKPHAAGVHRQQRHLNGALGVDPGVGAHAVGPRHTQRRGEQRWVGRRVHGDRVRFGGLVGLLAIVHRGAQLLRDRQSILVGVDVVDMDPERRRGRRGIQADRQASDHKHTPIHGIEGRQLVAVGADGAPAVGNVVRHRGDGDRVDAVGHRARASRRRRAPSPDRP